VSDWVKVLVDYASNNLTDRERDLLMGRGVSRDQMALYQLGHLNRSLPDGLPEHFTRWASEKIDDVYLFPLTNTMGAVRGFQLRHVDRSIPGYQDYFLDKSEACQFGLGQAIKAMWETRSVYLVEGTFDLFPIQRAMPAVVATLTAWCSPAMMRVLRRIVDRVYLGYDNDATGLKGHREFVERYGDEFEVYVVQYPKVPGSKIKDPGDLWEAWGDTQLVPFIQAVLNQSQEI
jgi:DNA primase